MDGKYCQTILRVDANVICKQESLFRIENAYLCLFVWKGLLFSSSALPTLFDTQNILEAETENSFMHNFSPAKPVVGKTQQ